MGARGCLGGRERKREREEVKQPATVAGNDPPCAGNTEVACVRKEVWAISSIQSATFGEALFER